MRVPKKDRRSDTQEAEDEALRIVSTIVHANAPVHEKECPTPQSEERAPLCTILQEMVVSERSPPKDGFSTEEALFAVTSLHEVL